MKAEMTSTQEYTSGKRLHPARWTYLAKTLIAFLSLSCGLFTQTGHTQVALPSQGVIATVAGNGTWGNSGDGGLATNAEFDFPRYIATDSAGNIYFSLYYMAVIKKVSASTGIITTIAGDGTAAYSGDGGPATQAELSLPAGLTIDSAGNIYFADSGNYVIRKISAATGVITTVAGTDQSPGYSGDGAAAICAKLANPLAVALDPAGNIYIADAGNNDIRKVSAATGYISTIAGNGTAGYSGDAGAATQAELNGPEGIAVDASGDIFISDSANNRVREVVPATGVISTVAGNGTAAYTGDGGLATSAELNGPAGIVLDSTGNIFVSDRNSNVIREVTASTGVIATIAGNGTSGFSGDNGAAISAELCSPYGLSLDSAGNLYIADYGNVRIRAVGVAAQQTRTTPTITWSTPASITYGTALSATQLNATASVSGTFTYSPASGTVPDAGQNALSVLFQPTDSTDYTPSMATVPLTVVPATPTITWSSPSPVDYGTALSATQLNATASVPGSFTYSPSAGTVLSPGTQSLVATFTPTDSTNYQTVTASVTMTVLSTPGPGIISTVAGDGCYAKGGDGGQALAAEIGNPVGLAFDSSGNLYVTQPDWGVVRKISASTGVITTVAGTGVQGNSADGVPATSEQMFNPFGIAVDGAGNIYIADVVDNRVQKISVSTGIITTIAGGTGWGYSGDGGPATSALIDHPTDVALDSSGNLYFVDYSNYVIRKISASTGIITTVAGNGTSGYSGDGGAATSAEISTAFGLAVDASGNLFIADTGNNVIREVNASTGIISTVAGNATVGYSGDGGTATGAELNNPMRIAVDAAGNLYIADQQNNVVRLVSAATGTISTMAGDGTAGYSGDGGPATSAELFNPSDLVLDPAGDLFIADSENNRIREVGSAAVAPVGVVVSPGTAVLYASQTQQFSASVTNSTNTAVTWSISPSVGSISSGGLYTAPTSLSAQQTVTITATSQANPSAAATALVTLYPAIAVSVTPATATLYGGQTQQFSAGVTNSDNTSVTWSISPSVGSISASGLYTSPASIATQQTVTVTATSQANSTISGSATITLAVTQCTGNGYAHQRSIVVDHTQVPNTDQYDFPMLVSGTYPFLATTANGGDLASPNGYDIIFTSDAAGQDLLNYEVDSYNPSTGTAAFWIRIPVLSHSSDTVIYMWYGNPAIATSQQSPSAVWINNYLSVYHLGNGSTIGLSDSTASGYSLASAGSPTAAAGFIGGGVTFSGDPGTYLYSDSIPKYPTGDLPVTIEAWVQMAPNFSSADFFGYGANSHDGSRISLGANSTTSVTMDFENQSLSGFVPGDNNWHHFVGVYGGGALSGTTDQLYVDGIPLAVSISGQTPDITNSELKIGGIPTVTSCCAMSGSLDEVRVSLGTRSGDWVAAEFHNQSSPSTFYVINADSAQPFAVPATVSLYGGQQQQFSANGGLCVSQTAVWSMPAGSPGILTPQGLYVAPANIDAPQTVTITGSTLGTSSQRITATVNLTPPISVNLTPGATSLSAGQSQQFVATVGNSADSQVAWSIDPAAVGTITSSGLYTAPSTFTSLQTVTVTATSQADPTQSASATITLEPLTTAPAVSVVVNPDGATVYGGQSQQFAATVSNTNNPNVTWAVSPSGAGTISASGLYSAPSTITTQQEVVITATSQADPSQSGSATITLAPTACAASGYAYVRQIVIDHTKIANSDQANFPFLFNSTDPAFRTVANGGHISNSNGFDLIFSEDPNGLTKLDHEIETYNPATGQVIAWIRIPTLSHSQDTVLYVFYGNPSTTTSQQNPTGVWDSNFGGVWHLGVNNGTLSTNDSTVNGNNATISGTVTPSPGEIGDGVMLTGSPNYLNAGSSPTIEPTHTGTMSLWVYYNSFGQWTTPMGDGNTWLGGNGGTLFWNQPSGQISFELDGGGATRATAGILAPNQWYYLTGAWDGTTVSLYQDGVLVASTHQNNDATPGYPLAFGVDGAVSLNSNFLSGALDEIRVSGIARSADWISTEYRNQSSPASFYALYPENTDGVFPSSISLYASQSQQFVAPGLCGGGITWTLSASAPGTLTSSGLYTAPASIASQESVTITATSIANPGESASATVTLYPPIGLSVNPGSVTLTENQTQQFTGVFTNSSDTAVTWSINPDNVGTLSPDGVYQAPASILTQQTLTLTATSVEDASLTATATITLAPTQCAAAGFGFERTIVIDHTKVPNTDEQNFAFLFNSTNPDFANLANGGHVVSLAGNDIMFSTDPTGATRLDEEIESYNPATGQLIAWIRVPLLSHSADTVLYMFYGNPAIAASQQNSVGVWDSDYTGVYHMAGFVKGSAADSTLNANNGTATSVNAVTGEIDGAGSFGGTDSYIQIPQSDFPSFPSGLYDNIDLPGVPQSPAFVTTFGVWFQTASPGGILVQTPSLWCNNFFFTCVSYIPLQPGDSDPGGWQSMLYVDDNGHLTTNVGIVSTRTYTDNLWHYAVLTEAADGTNNLYVDGQSVGTSNQATTGGYSQNYFYFVGTAYTLLESEGNWNWLYFNGNLDEVSVSKTARSADWVKTQYNNQASPSTFYTLSSASTESVVPPAISLYALQSQQFGVTGSCNTATTWSMPGGSPGSLSPTGLYVAPETIASQQTVTITGTDSAGTAIGTAVVTLLPPQPPILLSATGQSPYTVGSSQSFEATLQDQYGSPIVGVPVTFNVNGANSTIITVNSGANGVATFSYTGANSGTDAILATVVVNDQQVSSTPLNVSWILQTGGNSAGTITLTVPPGLGLGGLMGAFTDSTGAVVEPLAIGAAPTEYMVPSGATQLQLGINDTFYPDNGGTGFVIAVNGNRVTVPPTAMPWNWTSGGLNNNYQFGLNDGTAPVVAATGLLSGQVVTVAYQSGTVSEDYPLIPAVNANGDQSAIRGAAVFEGAYAPTLYTTPTSYPLSEAIPVSAIVLTSSGLPAANTAVTLTVSGANPGQYQATTDATGTATFMYTGAYAGADAIAAQTTLTGNPTITSSTSNVNWTNFGTPAPAGALSLSLFAIVNDEQAFAVLATDASGNPVPNANVGFYVSGVDNFEQNGVTDVTGHVAFGYNHSNSGNYSIVAVDSVGRNVVFSNVYNATWNGSQGSNGGTNQISVSISGLTTVSLPNTLQLTGSVTDNVGATPTVQWSQISGPGAATFSAPQQDVTTISFTDPGTYVVQLTATDTGATASDQFTIQVNPIPINNSDQGEIGSPLNGATVTGIVPIVLASGVTLQSGTLVYFPANNINDVMTLNGNTSGSGQIATLDTTTLANGSYWLQMQATDSNSHSQYSLLLVTVAGNYKPGRVTAALTDLTIPVNGLPIQIQRQYDSLNQTVSGDFGYGWNLSTSVNLTVDPKGDVTFTLGGQRRTFYLTPQAPPCTLVGCLFPYFSAAYTAEPGFYGTLTDASDSCPLGLLAQDGSLWVCYDGSGLFNPTLYTYTDANGTQYSISANGNLKSITDKNGNAINVTANGITSSTGLNVPFVRDSQGRITQITDPQGNNYEYTYDGNGNLETVTYPSTTQAATYGYASGTHLYAGGTDFRGNALPTTTYYGPNDEDASGNPLNGRLASVTDALNETTNYAYNIGTNTTTITYPADATGAHGTATMVYDSYGDLLSSTDPLNHTTVNVYDGNHNLASTADPLGHTTTYTYDSNGNRASVTYPATDSSTNTTSTTVYNQYSEPISTTDELGNARTFNYDGNLNPQSVVDSLGTLASFSFNPNGTLAAGAIGFDITQGPQMASQFTYDGNGNLASRTDALGRTTSYTYNNLGQKLTMTIPLPNSSTSQAAATTTYTYDPLGDVTQTAAPLGRTTSATYDGNGNRLTSTDARGKVTNYTYDSLNRLTLTTYPDSSTVSNSYDFRNNVIDTIDQDGHDTHNTYDLAGRLSSVTMAYGTSNASTTSYTYDNAGRKLTMTDALNATTTYTYDNAGNLVSVSGPGGSFQYEYDNARNRISVTDGNNHTTQYQYDARKRQTVTTYPDSHTSTNAYDGPGNLASVTDQAGNQVQYTYDAANQLHTVVQLASPNTGRNTNTYGYDPDGNLISLSDENSHTTQNGYDLLSDLTSKILPDGSSTETRTYDNNGNLATVTHFNGVTTTYSYDSLNRLLSRATPGEATVSHSYTATGKYATTTDASGSTTYNYDSMDRLTSKATPEGTLSYTYDGDGHVLSIASSNTNGASMSYTYDSLNRLSTVTDGRTGGVTTYTYDPANNLATAAYPNNTQSTFQYDQLNRLTGMATNTAGYLYDLGATGIKTGATESSGRTLTWSFDGIYRLTGETIANDPSKENGSVGYGLDPVGNRLTETSSLTGISSRSFSYNADDQLTGELYDANGNVTETGGNTFAYNSQNQLISMNSGAVTLVYDGSGNRVAKTANGTTTKYLVEDDVNPAGYPQVFDELTNGAVTRTYTYGLQRIDEEQVVNNAWTTSYFGYDGFGTVRQLTNSAGAVTDTYEYDAYGNLLNSTGTTPNVYMYRGEAYDSDLGLYYLRARYYNPLTGRFMSRDPEDGKVKDPRTLHKYLYAGGDPVNNVDPRGRGIISYALEIGESLATVQQLRLTAYAVCVEVTTLSLFIEDSPPPDWPEIVMKWCAPALAW